MVIGMFMCALTGQKGRWCGAVRRVCGHDKGPGRRQSGRAGDPRPEADVCPMAGRRGTSLGRRHDGVQLGRISLPVDRRVPGVARILRLKTAMSYRSSSFSTTIAVPVRASARRQPTRLPRDLRVWHIAQVRLRFWLQQESRISPRQCPFFTFSLALSSPTGEIKRSPPGRTLRLASARGQVRAPPGASQLLRIPDPLLQHSPRMTRTVERQVFELHLTRTRRLS